MIAFHYTQLVQKLETDFFIGRPAGHCKLSDEIIAMDQGEIVQQRNLFQIIPYPKFHDMN